MLGVNYGWRCYEGNHDYDLSLCGANPSAGKTFPIFEYSHSSSTGGFSITGGYVYRGTEFPDLYGYYICCDYSTARGWLIKPNGSGGWNVSTQTGFPASVSTFGEATDGTLYVASLSTNQIYKIVVNPTGIPDPPQGNEQVRANYLPSEQIELTTPYLLDEVQLINTQGQIVKRLNNISGTKMIAANNLNSGVYWLRCFGKKTSTVKLIVQ